MPKSPKTISVRLPPYKHPRNEWRKEIHAVVAAEAERRGVLYSESDQIEVWIKLYFDEREVYRVVVEKGIAPKQSRGLGYLKVRKFNPETRMVLRWH